MMRGSITRGRSLAAIRGDMELSRRDVLRVAACAVVGAPMASWLASANQDEPRLPREGVFELGDFPLESGTTLRNAKLGYKTHGRLDAARRLRRGRRSRGPGAMAQA